MVAQTFEGGYFIIMVILAFAFLFFEGRFSLLYRVLSIVLFFSLALIMFSFSNIVLTATSTDNHSTWTSSYNLITSHQIILAAIFLGFALVAFMRYFDDIIERVDAILKKKDTGIE